MKPLKLCSIVFAVCTGRFSSEALWPRQLREKLEADLPVFAGFLSSENEDLASFAEDIAAELSRKKE